MSTPTVYVFAGLPLSGKSTLAAKLGEQLGLEVFDVDVIGGLALKKVFGTSAISVFVIPPSMEILEQRLRGRGTESEKNIVRRLAKADTEMKLAESFDVKLVNDDLQKAILTIINTVVEFLKP